LLERLERLIKRRLVWVKKERINKVGNLVS
jgi:hypothetical protein